jgi:hypothetical protein
MQAARQAGFNPQNTDKTRSLSLQSFLIDFLKSINFIPFFGSYYSAHAYKVAAYATLTLLARQRSK